MTSNIEVPTCVVPLALLAEMRDWLWWLSKDKGATDIEQIAGDAYEHYYQLSDILNNYDLSGTLTSKDA